MSSQLSGQPILILREGGERRRGRDAQSTNIMAAKVIAEAVKSTLGPMGMDKMLVDSLGDIVVTNDGVTILKEMDIEHPAAKMMVEVAKTQENEVGDGTTTAVVIAGELLKRAEGLIEQEIHPTIVAQGYRMAADKTRAILEGFSEKISISDKETLKQIATTAMTGKGSESSRDFLAEIVVEAVLSVAEKEDSKVIIDLDDVKIEKKTGAHVEKTELVKGVVIDKDKSHTSMPDTVKNAKIALLNSALEVKDTEVDAEIRITDPNQLKAFLGEEEKSLRTMVEKIKNSGANAVFVQKGIDDLAEHYLAKAKIFAIKRVKKSDMEKLARATGANIATNLDDLTKNDLGAAGIVKVEKIGEDEMTFVKECKDPKSVTLLVRGGTEHIVDETVRSIEDALGVVTTAIKDQKIVAGGGAPEAEAAKGLRVYAKGVGGREQLAIEAFADSLEVIPRALAENAGLDPPGSAWTSTMER
jgi:thermosome